MKLFPHDQNSCPYCGVRDAFLTVPKLRMPTTFWSLGKRVKKEHLEVSCTMCRGTFQKRTAFQQSEVNNIRAYNDRLCIACGVSFNETHSTAALIERPSELHGHGCILASCNRCLSSWHMRTFEDQQRIRPTLRQAPRRYSEPVPATPMADYTTPEPRVEQMTPGMPDLPPVQDNKPS